MLLVLFVTFSCMNGNNNNLVNGNQNTPLLESKPDNGDLLLTDSTTKAQKRDSVYFAEIIEIENSKFINDIENLIKDNECINRNADLILDYTDKSGYLLLWQSSLKNSAHLYKSENKSIYVTSLNNNPFYILFTEENKPDLPIRKTGNIVDLSEYLANYIFVAHHFSYWYLARNKDGGAEIIKEIPVNCKK